jgi:hypothetical protein
MQKQNPGDAQWSVQEKMGIGPLQIGHDGWPTVITHLMTGKKEDVDISFD